MKSKTAEAEWNKVVELRDRAHNAHSLAERANTSSAYIAAAAAHLLVYEQAMVWEKAVGFLGEPGTSDTADIAKTMIEIFRNTARDLRAVETAPSLLDACKALLAMTGGPEGLDLPPANLDPRRVRAAAVAAIAAAEGK